ncbi:MAG: rhodanese-like domain-containing protein [Pseudomonadota bacterium]
MRPQDEYATAHIPGAIHAPLADLDQVALPWTRGLKSSPVAGGRSALTRGLRLRRSGRGGMMRARWQADWRTGGPRGGRFWLWRADRCADRGYRRSDPTRRAGRHLAFTRVAGHGAQGHA